MRRRYRVSTRSLMLAVAVFAVEGVVLVEATKLGPGIEFTLFIASVFLMLNILVPSYLAAGERINQAPPEKQAGELLRLGCFAVLIMVFLIPIVLVILLRKPS